ncbi:hypothetical protein CDO73_07055 [Saccharibacillus sp. O23]|uniref:hypothetical protein n=1 Tax=Saccharibacillus sp. O23 TaxID=2009338 RepID=UPI000B4E5D71|nr:hypothetical protein [Saccharibacillus sp. O23]OWR31479.1 hypothetical protein CDO73_07055 [Saccharibacillus sp. O23]
MNVSVRKKSGRLAVSLLAVLLLFGSLAAAAPRSLPSVSAESSEIRPPSGIGLDDENRSLLLKQARAMYAFNEFYKNGYDYEPYYPVFKQDSLDAFDAAFDPAATREELTAALQKFDGFPSIDLYIGNGDYGIDDTLFEMELQLHLYLEFGSEPGQWSEADAEYAMNEIALMRDRIYALTADSRWEPETWEIFWKYLNFRADLEDRRSGRKEIFAQTFQYRTDVLNRLTAGTLTEAQTAGFDDAVSRLEAVLATSGDQEAVVSAFAQVKSAYETLPTSGNPQAVLAAELEAARKLLDLPKGIRSGQYPASAFGDLRRAINEANLVVKRGSTPSELVQARSKLAAAVAEFHSRKKP